MRLDYFERTDCVTPHDRGQIEIRAHDGFEIFVCDHEVVGGRMVDQLRLEEVLGEFRLPFETHLARQVLHVIEEGIGISPEFHYRESKLLMELCQPLVVLEGDRFCRGVREIVSLLERFGHGANRSIDTQKSHVLQDREPSFQSEESPWILEPPGSCPVLGRFIQGAVESFSIDN